MLIPLNTTIDSLISMSVSVLVDRAASGHCDTIGHCRTVWNIIWSCLITIFACIWVAVHPNIPQPRPPVRRAQSKEGPRRWSLRRFLADWYRHQLVYMCISLGEKMAVALLALLAPEFIFVWALRQWLRARSIAEECRVAARQPSAVEGRRRRRAVEKDLEIAEQREELKFLRTSYAFPRTPGQARRRETLTELFKAPEKKKTDGAAAEVSQENISAFDSFLLLMFSASNPRALYALT